MSCNCNTTSNNLKAKGRTLSSRFRALLGLDRNGCEVAMYPDQPGVMVSSDGKIEFRDGSNKNEIKLNPESSLSLVNILGLDDSNQIVTLESPSDGIERSISVKDGEVTLVEKQSASNVFTNVTDTPVGKFAMFLQGVDGWSLRYLEPPEDDPCCSGKYLVEFDCDGTFQYIRNRSLIEQICGTTESGQLIAHDGDCKLKTLSIPDTECDPSLSHIYAKEVEREYEIEKECADGSVTTQIATVKEYSLFKSPYKFLPKAAAVDIDTLDPSLNYKIILYRDQDPDNPDGCLQDVQLTLGENQFLVGGEDGVLEMVTLLDYSLEEERDIYFNTPPLLQTSGSGTQDCSALAGVYECPAWANTAILRCTARVGSNAGGILINNIIAAYANPYHNSTVHNARLNAGKAFTYNFAGSLMNGVVNLGGDSVNDTEIRLMGYAKRNWL